MTPPTGITAVPATRSDAPAQACFDRVQCPGCGYSLVGLPLAGICPECGEEYDGAQIVIYGWSAARSATIATARPRNLFWAVLGSGGLMIVQSFINVSNQPAWSSVFLAVGLSFIGLGFYRRRRNLTETPAPVQLRISTAGWGIREGFGAVKLESWEPITKIEVADAGRKRFRVSIYHKDRVIYPIASLDCDGNTEVAEQFRERVRAWRNGGPLKADSSLVK